MQNTLSCPVPDNINPLSPNGFMFSVQKLPEVTFFCQEANLPGITIGAPEFANPFSLQPIPGETITYDTLNVKFLVDEHMHNYLSIFNWITALGFPQGYDQYVSYFSEDQRGVLKELVKNYSDGTLSILNSSNKVVKNVHFVDMFPVSLDSLVFQSDNNDVQYLVGNVTFRYGYYKFE